MHFSLFINLFHSLGNYQKMHGWATHVYHGGYHCSLKTARWTSPSLASYGHEWKPSTSSLATSHFFRNVTHGVFYLVGAPVNERKNGPFTKGPYYSRRHNKRSLKSRFLIHPTAVPIGTDLLPCNIRLIESTGSFTWCLKIGSDTSFFKPIFKQASTTMWFFYLHI